jgi:hypothetical protein
MLERGLRHPEAFRFGDAFAFRDPDCPNVVGWSALTFAKMRRYSHFGVDTLRDSIEKIMSQSHR